MNKRNIFKRARWNMLIALVIVMAIAMLGVSGVYAGILSAPLILADYGDLPDNSGGGSFPISYDNHTLHGAVHVPVDVNDPDPLRLGAIIDYETAGLPDINAMGDDLDNQDDEDGVIRDSTHWTPDATVNLIVTVNGCADTCYLNGWIDWGNDQSFDSDQIFTEYPISNGTHSLPIVVPSDRGYSVGDDVYARFRVCNSTGPTGSGCNIVMGYTDDGEVEDYFWEFGPTAVELVSIDAAANNTVPFALLAGALILLVGGGAILAIKRNRA